MGAIRGVLPGLIAHIRHGVRGIVVLPVIGAGEVPVALLPPGAVPGTHGLIGPVGAKKNSKIRGLP